MRITTFIALLICNLAMGCVESKPEIRCFGQVAEIRSDRIGQLKDIYFRDWSEVINVLNKYHIFNCSVFLKELEDSRHCLFVYYEYTGDDYESDMKDLSIHPKICKLIESAKEEYFVNPTPDNTDQYWSEMKEVFFYEGRNDRIVDDSNVEQYGMAIGIRPEMIESYTFLHKYTWPEVLAKISEGNIQNYSIYITELGELHYLFSYFEYVGFDFESDMKMIDSDPATIAWMKFTDEVCQVPLSTRKEGEWWALMDIIVSPE